MVWYSYLYGNKINVNVNSIILDWPWKSQPQKQTTDILEGPELKKFGIDSKDKVQVIQSVISFKLVLAVSTRDNDVRRWLTNKDLWYRPPFLSREFTNHVEMTFDRIASVELAGLQVSRTASGKVTHFVCHKIILR